MDRIEQKIIDLIDQNRDKLIAFGTDIYTNPELGYREFRTAEKFAQWLQEYDLPVETEIAVTGVKATLNQEKQENFSVALLGELDALRIPDHKYANPETGAAHCCGHNAQLTAVAGAVLALTDSEIQKELDGSITFFGVPAEEGIDLEFRKELVNADKIQFSGGKCELIRIGAFDDIDLSVVHHLDFNTPFIGINSSNGFVSKQISFEGRSTHAAVAPDKGINALAAANIGLHALGMNRETFRDDDHVRVHPIMTKGGTIVNAIPSDVVLETQVRGGTAEAMEDANKKTERCFVAGAMAMGAKVTFETVPGYMPGIKMPVPEALREAFQLAEPDKTVRNHENDPHDCGSSDVGDLQHIMPVVGFRTGGMVGGMHQADFDIVDEEEAYIASAKAFALIAYRLLKDGAALGKEIRDGYTPKFANKDAYTAFLNSLGGTKTYDFTQPQD